MKPAPTLADALAGARRSFAPNGVARVASTALVAGASGRLGERVLARLLAAPGYRRIYALASNPMPSTEAKLEAVAASQWDFQVDDVIAVIGEESVAHNTLRKRTEVFAQLSHDEVLPLARRAREAGARRFMLVSPIHVLSQPSAVYAGIANAMESELHSLDFASLLLLRPSDHAIRRRPGGLAKKLFNVLIDTATGLMVGLRHTPLTVEDIARVAVHAMQDSPAGLTIIETDRMHGLLRSRP